MTPYEPCASCTMMRIKLFMVVGAFVMGLIYFQLLSGAIGFGVRYYQMKTARANSAKEL